MVCGIYKIENKENGKVYVGSSKDINKRWYAHRTALMNKKHHNAKLQHAWNKSGGKIELEYSILEECDILKLFEREQHWMDHYDSYVSGYNCTRHAQGSPNAVKTLVWIKTEPLLHEMFQNIYEFQLGLKSSKGNSILVSHFGLKLEKASSNSAFIKRLWMASNMLLSIRYDLEQAKHEDEYRLHYIHYSGKTGGYSLSLENNQSVKDKYSVHDKTKRDNILNELWQDVQDCFTGRIGKAVKERYELYLKGVDVDGE